MRNCSVVVKEEEEEDNEDGWRGAGGGGGGFKRELAAPYSYASAECTQSCSCETCTHMRLYPDSHVVLCLSCAGGDQQPAATTVKPLSGLEKKFQVCTFA